MTQKKPREALTLIDNIWKQSVYNFSEILIDGASIKEFLKRKSLTKTDLNQIFQQYSVGEAFSSVLVALDIIREDTLPVWLKYNFKSINFAFKDCDYGDYEREAAGFYVIEKKSVLLCMEDKIASGKIEGGFFHDLMGTTIHELGHHLHYSIPKLVSVEFNDIGWNYLFRWLRDDKCPSVTNYGNTNHREDFAESFKVFFSKTYFLYTWQEGFHETKRGKFFKWLFNIANLYPKSMAYQWLVDIPKKSKAYEY